ncbi:hypothetical protein AVEN_265609-1 [Araneus ventricosus]|uniref:Uncharacterized protein n=1 Tax=Araneus ventricosus TaxID=182803 RepID=A0A4Y2IZX3_ARAVE|nr:hypothetical protein AVEN_265609-1 [Araneus ventricosus]
MQKPLVSAVVRIRHKIPPALAVVNLCIYISNHLPLQSDQPKPSPCRVVKLWKYSTLCLCRVANLCLINHPPLWFDHLIQWINISTFPPLRNDHRSIHPPQR